VYTKCSTECTQYSMSTECRINQNVGLYRNQYRMYREDVLNTECIQNVVQNVLNTECIHNVEYIRNTDSTECIQKVDSIQNVYRT